MMDSTRIPINWADTEDDFDKDTHSLVVLHLPMNYLSVLVHCMETGVNAVSSGSVTATGPSWT